MSAGEMRKNVASISPAVALASMVLPVPGGAVEEDPPAGADAESLGQVRVLEGVDHPQADVFLDIVQAGDIVESQRGFLLNDPLIGGGGGVGVGRLLAHGRGARARGRGAAMILLRVVAVAGQVQQFGGHVAPALAQFLALGFLAERQHRAGRLQQIDAGRIPLPGPAGIQALLTIPLECILGHGHDPMLPYCRWRSMFLLPHHVISDI